MKKSLILMSLVLGAMPSTRAGADLGRPLFTPPALVSVRSERIFAPPGFDSNDNAQLVVHGEYVSTCYKAAPPEVTIDRQKREIRVAPKAYLHSGCWCGSVMVPYTQAVDLGFLDPGRYRVVELDDQGALLQETSLTIAAAESAAPDEVLYAPVRGVFVEHREGKAELVLSGTFASDCMDLQEVRVLRRAPGIVEVLPLASFKTATICKSVQRPFEARVPLEGGEVGESLIHVRSLNGQAINSVELF